MKFRELKKYKINKANAFYAITSYKQLVSHLDRVFVVESDSEILAAVRVEKFEGIQVLRGMYLHPEHKRKGIGTKLLKFIEPVLDETQSYCIPFSHLKTFYSQIGFTGVASSELPTFLQERSKKYKQAGENIIVLHRPASLAI